MQTNSLADFYEKRLTEKYPTSDHPENDAVIKKAIAALELKQGSTLLDFGCADGFFINAFVKRVPGLNATGVDIVEHEAWQNGDSPVTFVASGGQPVSLPDESLDAIFCSQVIEHVIDAEAIIQDFRRLLKRGGLAWIATPNAYEAMLPIFHDLQRKIDEVEGHIRHFSDADFRQMASAYGFEVVSVKYDLFLALYCYYRYVIYNPFLKKILLRVIRPELVSMNSRFERPSRRGLAGNLTTALRCFAFAVMRTLRFFDERFSWYRGCQVIEVTLRRQ